MGQLVAANMLPAVWFIFSRRGCDQAAFYLAECGAQLVTREEEREIALALDAFAAVNPDAVRPEAVEPLLLGIASHHAGLLPGWKGLVENLFQRGLLKVVFATETLAAGVNMPARCSVMSALSKRGDNGPRMLTSNEFMQMCGRAGRRGYDTVGHVVACQSPFEGPEEAFGLVQSPPENLRSQFSISYGMVLNLLRAGKPLRQVRAIVERSFGNYLGGRARRGQVRELRRLREQADALREQIASGESVVEPEEWARYLKLDGRLKEERRLLKIISRQTEDTLAEVARAAVREAMELGEMPVIVCIETDDDGGAAMTASSPERPEPKPSTTVGLMPDGSWSMSSPSAALDGDARDDDVTVKDDIGEIFDEDESVDLDTDAEEDETEDEDDDDGDGGGGVNSARRSRTVIAVAIVEAYQPPSFEIVGGRNPFPLGEFVALAADGTWHRFAASRVRRVGAGAAAGSPGAGSDGLTLTASDTSSQEEAWNDGATPQAVALRPEDWSPGPSPVPNSLRWRRAGDGRGRRLSHPILSYPTLSYPTFLVSHV